MLWYVIQTYTGREEKLVEMIHRILPADLYGECFVAYHEQLRSRKQENQVHVERIFPGYAFITSDAPEAMFHYLKKVPAMSKLLSNGEFYFLPLEQAEAGFMDQIMDENHVIRLSYVATDGRNHVSYRSGPLESCGSRILEYQFRKRYALVRVNIAGQEKRIRMGIILNDDIRREVLYGKVEAPILTPVRYTAVTMKETGISGTTITEYPVFEQGDRVIVIEGAFEGNMAVVDQVKKNAVKITVHLFGREISAEVSFASIRKTA